VAIRMIRDLKAFRRAHGFTQVTFANLLRVKTSTLVAWEIGRYQPHGAQRSLLQLLAAEPELVLRVLLTGRPHLRPTRQPVPLKKSA
jgi:DNA-binding transcriptional regulator YiaG